MSCNFGNQLIQWLSPKNYDRNFISAGFYAVTITLISMSMVDLNWFEIFSNVCVPYLTLGEFFWFGYGDSTGNTPDYNCITTKIVNMMRIIILLCFMAIIFALLGFFLEIIGPKNILYKMLRRYAVPGTCTVIWIMLIICFSYYIVVLLQDAIETNYPKSGSSVTYGMGFYVLSIAGAVASAGVIYTLVLAHHPSSDPRDDDRCLIDGFDDGLDTFNSPIPPPPYNIPPPPYTP